MPLEGVDHITSPRHSGPHAAGHARQRQASAAGGTFRNQSIIVKGSSTNHTRDKLGDARAPRARLPGGVTGRRASRELLGAWREGASTSGTRSPTAAGRLVWRASRARAPKPPCSLISLSSWRGTSPELARALLRCFGPGRLCRFLLDDFKAQFTLDAHGDVYLVDGPSLLRAFPVGEAVYRATSFLSFFRASSRYAGKLKEATGAEERRKYAAKVAKFQAQLDALGEEKNNLPPPPSSLSEERGLSLDKSAPRLRRCWGDCEAGARGAPEGAGLCRAGACVAVGPVDARF